MKLIDKIIQGGIVIFVGSTLVKEMAESDEEYKRLKRKMFWGSLAITLLIVGLIVYLPLVLSFNWIVK